MKEQKYQDYKGFEELNTPEQFDQFEGQTLRGAKNRFVYDFSNIYPLRNLSYLGYDVLAGGYGLPGDSIQLATTSGIVKDLSYSTGFSDRYSTEKTVNGDKDTIYFNEETIAFIDSVDADAFGNVKLANYVDNFRSGYIEFSVKTSKQNCIIASGSSEIDVKDLHAIFAVFGSQVEQGVSVTSLSSGDTLSGNALSSLNYPYYNASSTERALVNLNIEIKNGKIAVNYSDTYNPQDVSFEFVGNENVADNSWHHVVINFGRPGILKERGNKFNKKYVEIWVDGSLDKHFDDKVNDFNIFYPAVKFLFNSPAKLYRNFIESRGSIFDSRDLGPNLPGSQASVDTADRIREVGFDEFLYDEKIFTISTQLDKSKATAFKGSIHTFAHGLNIPISKFEIQERYGLWKEQTKRFAKTINVAATMPQPAVSANSKKAIKLFWNNLTETAKFGVELDSNIVVDSYSVTHQSRTSKTEIYNVDVKNGKPLNIFTDVRVALGSNVLVSGPGMVMMQNTRESVDGLYPYANSASNWNPKDLSSLDVVKTMSDSYSQDAGNAFWGPRKDLPFSGLELNSGDRVLLTNQIRTEENGIWIFNGLDKYMTRATDALSGKEDSTNVVFVTDGIYKNTYWKLENAVASIDKPQSWGIVNDIKLDSISSSPVLGTRWKTYRGLDRFINLEEDVNVSDYDLIVFMNYPETNEEIFDLFPNDPKADILKQYQDFVQSLKNVAANGASLMVTSPKLAEDLGVVRNYEKVSQLKQESDAQSAIADPFEIGADAERYFDTHRNNKYHLATVVPGLTDKETYLLTDFINYMPENAYDYDEYHAKYSYRQFGIQEGNEFLIPGLAIRSVTDNPNIPGYRNNYRGSEYIWAVAPNNVLAGTTVTKFSNTYYNGSTVTTNPYDDYVTTIVVHDGQLLGTQPINGKIFVNCSEDSYALSREEYNKAVIQTVDPSDPYETIASRNWQYSTKRLNRSPQRINVSGLTVLGQTTPTNGGGGAAIQVASASSNGIIRSETDFGVIDRQSDLYATESEEIYPIQEIPVLSMTWLGLKWLEG